MNLHFNIILSRNILDAFVIYFLPLIVILFALFAIFLFISREKPESLTTQMGQFTALLFALIVLHGNFRNKYPVGGIMYLEYLFFICYSTLLISVFLTAALKIQTRWDALIDQAIILIKIFYWPIQLSFWFITTIIAFYY